MNAARASLLALLLCWAFAAFADVAVPPLSGGWSIRPGRCPRGDIASLTQTLKASGAQERQPGRGADRADHGSLKPSSNIRSGSRKPGRSAARRSTTARLLVVAKNDRKLRIEVGYGLEGALNDVTAKRIIDEVITPKFRNGDFAGGISAGVDRIIGVIDGEPLPAPAAAAAGKVPTC